MSSRPAPQDAYVRLWTGENPALHDTLLEQLQSADIPFADQPFGSDQIAPTADPLPIDARPRFGFYVSVPSRHLRQAREILESLLDREDLTNVELPAFESAPNRSQPSRSTGTEAEELPTVQVWTGTDRQLGQFLTAALDENEIPHRLEKRGSTKTIYVAPSQSARAREIVREITEAAPPS
jgi:hypothetical protein